MPGVNPWTILYDQKQVALRAALKGTGKGPWGPHVVMVGRMAVPLHARREASKRKEQAADQVADVGTSKVEMSKGAP